MAGDETLSKGTQVRIVKSHWFLPWEIRPLCDLELLAAEAPEW